MCSILKIIMYVINVGIKICFCEIFLEVSYMESLKGAEVLILVSDGHLILLFSLHHMLLLWAAMKDFHDKLKKVYKMFLKKDPK